MIENKKNNEFRKEKFMAEKERTDENTIFVGNKPPMSYVLAVVTQFNGG